MIFAAMVAVLSSCSKNEIELIPENESKDIVLNVSVSDPCAETKALIKTGWVKDDIISIWYDANVQETPDLVIKYAGNEKWIQKKDAPVSGKKPSTGDGKYAKALYNGTVKVASKDSYTYKDTILTFKIEHWTFLTELQVVVKELDNNADKYALACDKFIPISGAGYAVHKDTIISNYGTGGSAVPGISNENGVAFVFATADYSKNSSDKKDFIFTLIDKTGSPTVAKFYEPNVAIEAKPGKSIIKALTIERDKFVVPDSSPLSGEFSVSVTKKVRFSKGNLVASIDANRNPIAWKFAAHQYDRLGANRANTTIGTAAGYVDLLGWSTKASSNNWGIHTSSTDEYTGGDFKDWGTAIDNNGLWRTLTEAEWQYLTYHNTDYPNHPRFCKYICPVKVCGVENCLVLLPDDYDKTKLPLPDPLVFDEWTKYENAGFVCLPPTGTREGMSVKMPEIGHYWSSDPLNGTSAFCLDFPNPNDEQPYTSNGSRYHGFCVRLVTDVKN